MERISRGFIAMIAAALLLGACGDDGGGGRSLDDLVDNMEEELEIDRETAQCVVDWMVDEMGEDRLREISETDGEPTDEEGFALIGIMIDCGVE